MHSGGQSRFGWRSRFVSCVVEALPCVVCVVAGGWRTWPLLTIWTVGCSARALHGDRQLLTDCCLFGVVYAWLSRQELAELAVKRRNQLFVSIDIAGWSTLCLGLGITAVLAGAVIGLPFRRAGSNSKPSANLPSTARQWALEHPPSRIFPCRTTHARFFPKRHAFGYSYLQCGFPVVPEATTVDGMDVSSGGDQRLGRWWMCVKAEDYLERGNRALGFYGKLKSYLRQQVSPILPSPRPRSCSVMSSHNVLIA